MFEVTGITPEGVAYRVQVGSDVRYQADQFYGCAAGSQAVLRLLRLNEGEAISVAPTGPVVVLDVNRPESVLAALHGLTHVVDVTGEDVPEVFPPGVEGAVY